MGVPIPHSLNVKFKFLHQIPWKCTGFTNCTINQLAKLLLVLFCWIIIPEYINWKHRFLINSCQTLSHSLIKELLPDGSVKDCVQLSVHLNQALYMILFSNYHMKKPGLHGLKPEKMVFSFRSKTFAINVIFNNIEGYLWGHINQ